MLYVKICEDWCTLIESGQGVAAYGGYVSISMEVLQLQMEKCCCIC